MASVRITGKLIEHVQNSIVKMFAARLANVNNQIDTAFNGDLLYASMVDAPTQKALAEVPEAFMYRSQGLHFKLGDQAFAIQMSAMRPVHSSWTYASNHTVTDEMPGVKEVRALQARRTEINAERDALVANVTAILNECVTLQQVLEVWPTILDHIPPESRERHNAPTVKTKSIKPVLDGLMNDNVKTALMKATMLAKAA